MTNMSSEFETYPRRKGAHIVREAKDVNHFDSDIVAEAIEDMPRGTIVGVKRHEKRDIEEIRLSGDDAYDLAFTAEDHFGADILEIKCGSERFEVTEGELPNRVYDVCNRTPGDVVAWWD